MDIHLGELSSLPVDTKTRLRTRSSQMCPPNLVREYFYTNRLRNETAFDKILGDSHGVFGRVLAEKVRRKEWCEIHSTRDKLLASH